MAIDFIQPLAILGLLVLPAFWLIDRFTRVHLPRTRRRLVLYVRVLVTTLLILGLAGPRVTGPAEQQAIAFLVDVSDSITPEMREQQLAWLRAAMAGMGERDQAAVIVFGKEAALERPLSRAREIGPIRSIVDTSRTNIAAAIQLALATLPNSMDRKIVVISDGNENTGKAIEQAQVASAAGVPIYTLLLGQQTGPEVLVRQVETPPFVREGEKLSAAISIDATADTRVQVHLMADGKLVASQQTDLTRGTNKVVIPQEPLGPGHHVFQVLIEGRDDTFVQNNEGGSYTIVTGKPRILVLESADGETKYLAEALRSAGLGVDVKPASQALLDLSTLRGYESLVLANVPAEHLSASQLGAITSYVRDLGGGLVVIGGEQSYGVGRYSRTPLEEALPVRMDLRGRTLTASVVLQLVIDVSGSMAGGSGTSSKMELAKEAAIQAIGLLSESDQVGVLSFDDSNHWIQRPAPLTDPSATESLISALGPAGGTAIYPAVEEGYNAIRPLEAKVKHILLLTDGLSSWGPYEELMRQVRQSNITLSSVAIGTDADRPYLQRLAELGGGRYFDAIDPYELPQMVIKDTQEVARAAIVEEPFRPVQVGASPILDGIDAGQMPPLLGYVATTPKPGAQVLLTSPQGDPILSEWQYGLGHVVSWTSDAKNRWAQDWLGWPELSRFWAQAVKRTIPTPGDRNLQVQIDPEDDSARITVDAVADDKTHRNFLQTRATVVDPASEQREIALPQIAPGRYEGRVPIGMEGAYFLNVTQLARDGSLQGALPSGFVIPYSPEYRDLRSRPDLLGALAGETGGQVLGDSNGIFGLDRRGAGQPRDLWPWLLTLASLVFLLDVAARRLRLGWMDAHDAWAYVLDHWLGRGHLVTGPAAAKLLRAKGRIAIAGSGLRMGRSGVVSRAGTSAAEPSRSPAGGRTASSSAMGARLLDARRRAARREP
jgi:uncharacterized membrane protein/Mg-chelatase subunit ChlD